MKIAWFLIPQRGNSRLRAHGTPLILPSFSVSDGDGNDNGNRNGTRTSPHSSSKPLSLLMNKSTDKDSALATVHPAL